MSLRTSSHAVRAAASTRPVLGYPRPVSLSILPSHVPWEQKPSHAASTASSNSTV